MEIISHRGYWKDTSEKNTEAAFRRSFEMQFGTETDVRDDKGELVISHDCPTGGEMPFKHFINLAKSTLALNIKSDGLAEKLKQQMASYKNQWFVFDMSVPDMRSHFKAGNPVFTRMSEVEQHPAWIEKSAGVWLDGFESEWYSNDTILTLIRKGKKVCVVSPELHGRQHNELWKMLKEIKSNDQLILCTDRPEEARSFFGVRT